MDLTFYWIYGEVYEESFPIFSNNRFNKVLCISYISISCKFVEET